MASSNDPQRGQEESKQRYDPSNPFVSFKRFVDEQFDSLIERTFGSNPFIVNPAVSHEAFKTEYNRLRKEMQEAMGLRPAPQDSEDRTTRTVEGEDNPWRSCPYRGAKEDALSEEDQQDLRSFLNSELFSAIFPWTLTRHSPDASSQESDPRKAEEPRGSPLSQLVHLMDLETPPVQAASRPLVARPEHGHQSGGRKADVDFPKWWANGVDDEDTVAYDDYDVEDTQFSSREQHTTHTAQRTLGMAPEDDQGPQPETLPAKHPGLSSKVEPPSILSTLTTTETVTLPDGSVRTTTVLKKRFSDGREESSESRRTCHPGPQPSFHSSPFPQTLPDHLKERKEQPNGKPRKGWFWS